MGVKETTARLIEIVEREFVAMEVARQTKPRPAHPKTVHLQLDTGFTIGSLTPMIQTLRENCHAPRVILDIDGSGGAVEEAWRLYGALRAHSGEVECRVQRNACSGATTILSAGHVRAARRSATLTLHGIAGDYYEPVNAAIAKAVAASTGGDFREILKANMSGPVRDIVKDFRHHEQVIGFEEAQKLGFINKELAMPASRDMLDSLRRELVEHGRGMLARLEQRMDAPPERKQEAHCSRMIAHIEKQLADGKAVRPTVRVRHL